MQFAEPSTQPAEDKCLLVRTATVLSAGMASSAAEEIMEACGVCKQEVRDARVLPCLHSLCLQCAEQLLLAEGDGYIQCPLCLLVSRLPVGGTAALPMLADPGDPASWASTVDEGESFPARVCALCIVCDEHREATEASTICERCQILLCASHTLAHITSAPVGEAHSIRTLAPLGLDEETGAGGRPSMGRLPLCPSHNQPMKIYCGKCDTAICGECGTVGEHRDHRPLRYRDDPFRQRRDDLAVEIGQLEERVVTGLQKTVETVDNVRTDLQKKCSKVRQDIRYAGKRAMATVKDQMEAMIQGVDDVEEMRLKVLDQQREDLVKHIETSRNAIRFGRKVLANTEGNSLALLRTVETRVAGLRSASFLDRPQRHSLLKFRASDDNVVVENAKASIGRVDFCQASATNSYIEGPISRSFVIDENASVSFTLRTVSVAGEALTVGGDVINLRWAESVNTVYPDVNVADNGDGTYTISCMPTAPGLCVLETFVNGEKMSAELSIKTRSHKWEWDPSECHPKVTISDDRQTAHIASGGGLAHLSVVGSAPMRHGEHIWKVKIGPASNFHMLGIATKPLSAARKRDYSTVGYCWFNCTGYAYYRHDVQVDGQLSDWSGGDTFQLCLNCDRHTLRITNMRSGETSMFRNLPDKEFFQFADLFHSDNMVKFVD